MNLLPAQIAGSIYDETVEEIENHLLLCAPCQTAAMKHLLLVGALQESEREARGTRTGKALELSQALPDFSDNY